VQIVNGSITTSNNAEEVKIELAKGIYIGVNVDPTKVFHYDASQKGKGLFSDLQLLANDLDDPTKTGKDINEYLGYIDQHITNLLGVRAELGARMNRVELMEDRINQQEVIAKKVLSDNEDVDMERVITDLKVQESVHRAALAVGARIIQPTLVDFLR
jgi:flagellar hook-associated protein 3 FlgL